MNGAPEGARQWPYDGPEGRARLTGSLDVWPDAVLTPAALGSVRDVDAHLDVHTSQPYRDQPLASDWARITKVCEEAGEVWRALSKLTGENPRKGVCGTEDELLSELADTAMAAMCGIQHLTKDTGRTHEILAVAMAKSVTRIGKRPGEAGSE